MFENVPIEKRLKVILGLIGFVFLISVFNAFQVRDIYGKIGELEQKTAVVENADLAIVNRQVRLKELSAEIRGLQQSGMDIPSHAAFIAYIDQACKDRDLQLISLPREERVQIEAYRIAAIEFAVEGMFHDMLALIYRLEQIDRVGTVARVSLERKSIRTREGRKEILVATILVNRLLEQNNTANENS